MNETSFFVPDDDGSTRTVALNAPAALETATAPPASRKVYSAANVVADPLHSARNAPNSLDWDATMSIRHRLWDLGLGIAESMDTAQRGMGLSPDVALELGRRTVEEGARRGGNVVVGIATDSIDPGERGIAAITDAYLRQLREIEGAGGRVVMMASRQLAAAASEPGDYTRVYSQVLSEASAPVVLHWLGDMFDPALRGYWGAKSPQDAAATVLELIEKHSDIVDGIKLSLLDADFEQWLRSRLPENVRLYTGDDFNYVDLIAGDETAHSDALLGAFSVVPRFASAAFAALDGDDAEEFRRILGPTEELSRAVFEAPTQFYKVGVTWLNYLTGWQDHFVMIDGFQSGRSTAHLGKLVEISNRIGLFPEPELSAGRANAYFRGIGIG